jgi:Na+-transporting methylmalonyl-CoA/oxaloacetate decarboxylase beta subunit
MDEYVIKQKIQKASFEPRAPEELIQQVILRTQAVAMGVRAQKQLETAPAEKIAELASCVVIGQLAAVSALPKGARPEQLAGQLEQQANFLAALRGGNVAQRLSSGKLLQQITGQDPTAQQIAHETANPQKEGPAMI